MKYIMFFSTCVIVTLGTILGLIVNQFLGYLAALATTMVFCAGVSWLWFSALERRD